MGSPALDQLAFADVLERGELDHHLRRMRPIYRGRRDALLAALDAPPARPPAGRGGGGPPRARLAARRRRRGWPSSPRPRPRPASRWAASRRGGSRPGPGGLIFGYGIIARRRSSPGSRGWPGSSPRTAAAGPDAPGHALRLSARSAGAARVRAASASGGPSLDRRRLLDRRHQRLPGDQPRRPAAGQERERPAGRRPRSGSRTRSGRDVDPQPQQPGGEAALLAERPHPRDVRHAAQPPDDRDVAVVAVAERLDRLAAQAGEDRLGRVGAALDAALGDARAWRGPASTAGPPRRRRRRPPGGPGP